MNTEYELTPSELQLIDTETAKAVTKLAPIINAARELESEISDLRHQLNAANARLDAVPAYVFSAIQMHERGEMIIPSLNEWLGVETTYASVEDVTHMGYTVIIRRMVRVQFGVILRRRWRGGTRPVAVYAAGETVSAALSRALLKMEGKGV